MVVLLFPVAQTMAGISVENGLTQVFKVNPGQTYTGEIEISNFGDKDQYARIYQRDYLFNYKGEAFYKKPGSIDRSNAKWIDINGNYVKVPAHKKLTVQYEIKVPDDSLLTGSYWSVILVEGVNEIDTNSFSKGVNIQTVMRYAIQVITNIGNTGMRKLEFMAADLVKEDSVRYLQVDLKNSGERYLRPVLKLELFDKSGKSAGVFTAQPRKTYPGTSVRIKVYLDAALPEGIYQALLVADTGEDDVFGVNLSLEIKDG